MANHASALKRHRQSIKRNLRNVSVKSNIKTAIKRVKEAVAGGKAEDAKTTLATVTALLDKAASAKVLHRNNASRKISRLTKQVGAIKAQ